MRVISAVRDANISSADVRFSSNGEIGRSWGGSSKESTFVSNNSAICLRRRGLGVVFPFSHWQTAALSTCSFSANSL
nr:MAG TPA: hypothetical protein [Caudoviricetes sp.]